MGESKSHIVPVIREGNSRWVEDNGSHMGFLPVGHLFNGPGSVIEDLTIVIMITLLVFQNHKNNTVLQNASEPVSDK